MRVPLYLYKSNAGLKLSAPGIMSTLASTDLIINLGISDRSTTVSVTLSSTYGLLTLSTDFGLIYFQGDGLADQTIIISGSLIHINEAISNVTYNSGAYSGHDQIRFSVTNERGLTKSKDILIYVGNQITSNIPNNIYIS